MVTKILVIQLRRIGDVIVTTPVIGVLRRRFPDAQIDFLVEPGMAPVLDRVPGLSERLVFEKSRYIRWAFRIRRRRYDWVLDFMNNPRSAQLTWLSGAPVRAGFTVPFWGRVYTHRVPRATEDIHAVQNKFRLLRALGVEAPPDTLPSLSVDESDRRAVEEWAQSVGLGGFPVRIAIMPMHRHSARQWPLEKFKETLGLLSADSRRGFLLVGGPDERAGLEDVARPFPGRAYVLPAGTLGRAAAALASCGVALTNDSGLMHLAVSVGVPTVTVYGPTSPGSWNPGRSPHRYLQAEGLACLQCYQNRCPFGHECMEWISAERVAREVESVWGNGKSRPNPIPSLLS